MPFEVEIEGLVVFKCDSYAEAMAWASENTISYYEVYQTGVLSKSDNKEVHEDLIYRGLELRDKGYSWRQISVKIGVPLHKITRLCLEARPPQRTRYLTDEDKAEIIRLKESGMRGHEIAKLMGVSRTTVYDLLNHRLDNSINYLCII